MPPAELDALLLAAGLGTRLHPLTEQIPKALLPIYGVPLLDYHLARLLGSPNPPRIRRVTVNGHHLADAINAHLTAHPHHDRLAFSFEPEIRGTGGAIAHAAENLRTDPFLVLNTKVLLAELPIARVLDTHRRGRFAVTLVLVRAPAWANVQVENDRVIGIVRDAIEEAAWAFTGVQLVSRRVLRLLPIEGPHDIRDTYDRLIAERRLGAFLWQQEQDPFLAIATPADYLAAHRAVATDGACHFGLSVRDLVARGGIRLAEGYGYIDASARVGDRCRVEESVVLSGAVIAPRVNVSHCIIGPGMHVASDAWGRLLTTVGTREIE
jgi:NDP-sugar pyrophosphorylase family protein